MLFLSEPEQSTPKEKMSSGLQLPFQAFRRVRTPLVVDMATSLEVFEATAAR